MDTAKAWAADTGNRGAYDAALDETAESFYGYPGAHLLGVSGRSWAIRPMQPVRYHFIDNLKKYA